MADQNPNSWAVVSNKKTSTKSSSSASSAPVATASVAPTKVQSYWPETVVLRKNLPPPTVKMEKMNTPNSNRSLEVSQHQRRIENDAEEGITKKKVYTDSFRQKLMQTRREMGNLTQKQFAQKLSVSESLIKGIENGSAVYDPAVVTKITNTINRMNQKAKRDAEEIKKQDELIAKTSFTNSHPTTAK